MNDLRMTSGVIEAEMKRFVQDNKGAATAAVLAYDGECAVICNTHTDDDGMKSLIVGLTELQYKIICSLCGNHRPSKEIVKGYVKAMKQSLYHLMDVDDEGGEDDA